MVDFPDPEGPTTAVNFPSGIRMLIFFKTVTTMRETNCGKILSGRPGYMKLTFLSSIVPLIP